MLSLYDAAKFSVHKRTFQGGFWMTWVFVAFFLLAALVSHGVLMKVPAFRMLTALPLDSAAAAVRFVLGFWAILSANTYLIFIVLQVSALMLFFMALTHLIFFNYYFARAKRDLFQYPPTIHFWFFVRLLGKAMLFSFPVLTGIYALLDEQVRRIFTLAAAPSLAAQAHLPQPFGAGVFIAAGLGLLLYFAYAYPLFSERFAFRSVVCIKTVFQNRRTFAELLGWTLVTTLIFAGLQGLVALVFLHADHLTVSFFFMTAYVLMMVLFAPARIWFCLPIVPFGLLWLALDHYLPTGSSGLVVPLMTSVFGLFFIFFLWSAYFAVIAHLFAQTGFVYQKQKTPKNDVKAMHPERLAPIQDQYDTFLDAHNNKEQANYFHHL